MQRLTRSLFASLGLVLATTFSSLADVSSTRNFYEFGDRLLTSGQPNEAALKSAAKDGIEVVINLVPESESIYNPREGEILEKQGVEYIHIPVSWRSPKSADLEKFMTAMKRTEGKKVLVHCWANARASAFAYAYQVAKAPGTQGAEWERLKKVWSDVAGYRLDRDVVWQSYLKENAHRSN